MATFRKRVGAKWSARSSPIDPATASEAKDPTQLDENLDQNEDRPAFAHVETRAKDDDDRVGYRRPPKAHRFQKGRSGNPQGREPGRRDVKTDVLSALGQRVAVTEDGKRRTVSMQTVIVRRMVADAARGDAKARDQLLRLIGSIELASSASAPDEEFHDVEDAKILERFRARLVEEIKAERNKS